MQSWSVRVKGIALAIFAEFLFASAAWADSVPVQLQNPLDPQNTGNCTTLLCPVASVTNFLFEISIPICAIFIIVGGFQMMTASDNPEKFSKGKKTILYAVVGFAVVLVASSVANLIKSVLGGS